MENNKMNKDEFIRAVAEKANSSMESKVSLAVTKAVTEATFDIILDEILHQRSVQIMGFGTFESKIDEPKRAKNPQTGEPFITKRKLVPKLVWSPTAKQYIKENSGVK